MELNNLPVNLTLEQIRKLLRGETATLKPNVFDPKSSTHLRLLQKTLQRIIKAHKNGKGVRVCLSPEEEIINLEGGKLSFKKAFKNVGKEIKKDSGVVKRTFTSDKAMNTYKKIGQHAIEEGIPVAAMLASMAMGDPTGASGAVVGNIASQYASKAYEDKVMKEGDGLFKALHKAGAHKYGINKKTVTKRAKQIGKEAINIGADAAGEAITAYTGNPMAGEAFKVGAKRLGDAALDSKRTKDVLKNMKKEAKNIGVELVDDYIDKNLTGVERDIAQKALAGKYPSAKDLVYDYGTSKIEETVQLEPNPFMSGYGIVKVRKGKHGIYVGNNRARVKGSSKQTNDLVVGGMIKPPPMPSNVIQKGSNVADLESAQMQNKFMMPSPQLAPPIKRGGALSYPYTRDDPRWRPPSERPKQIPYRGGSIYPSGRPNYGGSMYPGG